MLTGDRHEGQLAFEVLKSLLNNNADAACIKEAERQLVDNAGIPYLGYFLEPQYVQGEEEEAKSGQHGFKEYLGQIPLKPTLQISAMCIM